MTNISKMHFILKIKFFVSGITIKVLSLRKTMHTKNFLSIINLKLSSFLYPFLSHFLFFFYPFANIVLDYISGLFWLFSELFFKTRFLYTSESFPGPPFYLNPLHLTFLDPILSFFFSGPPLLVITHRKKSRRSKT